MSSTRARVVSLCHKFARAFAPERSTSREATSKSTITFSSLSPPVQTLPGKWVVSDFLLKRATEDYDKLLELDDKQIDNMNNKASISKPHKRDALANTL